jgi:hypothetical protein
VTEPEDTGAGASGGGRVGLVGKTLGRYRISAELGRGGMATVYRAFDPQLQRDVAIKVIHGAFTGRGDIERRFQREAQAVASLKHESIVDIFDFAPGGDGEPAYIVSELVEGPTLRQLLERAGGRVLPEIAVIVGARVASALGAAHARGIVHRDVKPDNVMIDLGAGGVRVKLTDFGIARMTEDDTMTATGSILGSPAYMSPEQAKSGTIGPASDVFSLGVTLYQMATGRMPFAGKDPLTVIAALIAGEFLRPTQVDAHVSPELEGVILRCLKRAPGERYADGRAAAAALGEVEAAAAGRVGDAGAALRACHADVATFARALGGPVADDATARARAAIRRGELTKALAQINRALAYAPGHRGAEALLATISRRRRWARGATVVAAALVAGGAVVGLRARRTPALPASPIVAPAPVVVAPTPIPSPPSPTAPSSTTAAENTAARDARTSIEAKSAGKGEAKKRGHARHVADATAPANAPSVSAAAPSVESPTWPAAAPVPAPTPTPTPTPVTAPSPHAAVAPTLVGSITLRAWQGFCSPSLDDRPPALRPIYEHVPIGAHQISCTMPGGLRVPVARYELRAATHPDLIILRGDDGRPMLGRPQ